MELKTKQKYEHYLFYTCAYVFIIFISFIVKNHKIYLK